ncbi:hypothetical protein EFB14_28865 [Rhizobium fabae]|uniref:Uncharacterized protein n=1 Tax=Rhizobium fabae TaxID=573179 RepID=A0ABY0B139_9HYPH|nr:hypothetical protein EFB14_28865 [Rhizobium fabae]
MRKTRRPRLGGLHLMGAAQVSRRRDRTPGIALISMEIVACRMGGSAILPFRDGKDSQIGYSAGVEIGAIIA